MNQRAPELVKREFGTKGPVARLAFSLSMQ